MIVITGSWQFWKKNVMFIHTFPLWILDHAFILVWNFKMKILNFCKFCCLRSVLLTLFYYRYILVIFDKYCAIPTRYLSCWQGANENRCEFRKMLMALKLVEISIVIVGSQLHCVAFLPFHFDWDLQFTLCIWEAKSESLNGINEIVIECWGEFIVTTLTFAEARMFVSMVEIVALLLFQLLFALSILHLETRTRARGIWNVSIESNASSIKPLINLICMRYSEDYFSWIRWVWLRCPAENSSFHGLSLLHIFQCSSQFNSEQIGFLRNLEIR